jgi:hypothetical protein
MKRFLNVFAVGTSAASCCLRSGRLARRTYRRHSLKNMTKLRWMTLSPLQKRASIKTQWIC